MPYQEMCKLNISIKSNIIYEKRNIYSDKTIVLQMKYFMKSIIFSAIQ